MTETTKSRRPRPVSTRKVISGLSPEAQAKLAQARATAAEREKDPEVQRARAVRQLAEGRGAQSLRLEPYGLQLSNRNGSYGGKLVRDAEALRQADLDAGRDKPRYFVQMATPTLSLVEAFLNAHANAEGVGVGCATVDELVEAVIEYGLAQLLDPGHIDPDDVPTDEQIARAILWYRGAVRSDVDRQRELAARKVNRGPSRGGNRNRSGRRPPRKGGPKS